MPQLVIKLNHNMAALMVKGLMFMEASIDVQLSKMRRCVNTKFKH